MHCFLMFLTLYHTKKVGGLKLPLIFAARLKKRGNQKSLLRLIVVIVL